jgi:hypothetical protein
MRTVIVRRKKMKPASTMNVEVPIIKPTTTINIEVPVTKPAATMNVEVPRIKPTTTINVEVSVTKPPEPFPIVDLLNVKNHEELRHCLDYFLESLTDDNEGEKILEAYEYTMKLPVSYYGSKSYDKWMRVGWALCNTNRRLFIVWIALSAKYEKFKFKDIKKLFEQWKKFKVNDGNGLSTRSIIFWVNEEEKQK